MDGYIYLFNPGNVQDGDSRDYKDHLTLENEDRINNGEVIQDVGDTLRDIEEELMLVLSDVEEDQDIMKILQDYHDRYFEDVDFYIENYYGYKKFYINNNEMGYILEEDIGTSYHTVHIDLIEGYIYVNGNDGERVIGYDGETELEYHDWGLLAIGRQQYYIFPDNGRYLVTTSIERLNDYISQL